MADATQNELQKARAALRTAEQEVARCRAELSAASAEVAAAVTPEVQAANVKLHEAEVRLADAVENEASDARWSDWGPSAQTLERVETAAKLRDEAQLAFDEALAKEGTSERTAELLQKEINARRALFAAISLHETRRVDVVVSERVASAAGH
jgi:hypothetical protein